MDFNKDNGLISLLATCVQATIALNGMTDIQNSRLRRRRHFLAARNLLRKQQMLLIMAASSLAAPENSFWESECQTCTDETFKRHFRMRRDSFELLVNLMKMGDSLHKSISLEKCVALALYTLGTTEDYRVVSELFGVTRTTLCNVLLKFCSEAWKVLWPRYLNPFPLSKETVQECVQGFKKRGFPQCLGVLDACHIYANRHATETCLNQNAECSTKLFALIDANTSFLYINIGNPGYKTNADIYSSSQLKKQLDDCALLEALSDTLEDLKVPVFVIGTSKFKLAQNLLTPFAVVETDDQRHFNEALEKCQADAHQAFLQLKARFKRISAGVASQNVGSIARACCVLHNFLIASNDEVSEQWLKPEEKLPSKAHNFACVTEAEANDDMDDEAVLIRAALSKYFGKATRISHKRKEGETSSGVLGDELTVGATAPPNPKRCCTSPTTS